MNSIRGIPYCHQGNPHLMIRILPLTRGSSSGDICTVSMKNRLALNNHVRTEKIFYLNKP